MKGRKTHVCLHHGICSAIAHPSVWAGVAGILSTLGAELDKPYSFVCYGVSALCSLVAIVFRTPQELPTQEGEHPPCQP